MGIAATHSPHGLVLPPNLTFAAWAEKGQTLLSITRAVMWWIGDWFCYGEAHFGEEAAQAVDTGYAAKTVQQAARVSERFPLAKRLAESVSWSVHLALAGVENEAQRFDLLALAAQEQWTVQQVRERVRGLGNGQAIEPAAGRSVEMGDYLLTLFEEQGVLEIQHRGRQTKISLARSMFTDEAVQLVQRFLDSERCAR